MREVECKREHNIARSGRRAGHPDATRRSPHVIETTVAKTENRRSCRAPLTAAFTVRQIPGVFERT